MNDAHCRVLFFSLHVCLCDWHDFRLSLQIDNVYYPSIKAVACKCVASSVTHSSQVMADGIQTTEYARNEPNFVARVVFPPSRFYVWTSMFLCSGYKMHFPVLASVLPLTWRRKDNFLRNLRSSSWWHYFVIFWMKSRDMRFIDGFREAVSIQKEHTLPSFARTYHSNDRSNMQILCKMYHFICILMLIRVMIFVASARDFVLKTEVSHH